MSTNLWLCRIRLNGRSLFSTIGSINSGSRNMADISTEFPSMSCALSVTKMSLTFCLPPGYPSNGDFSSFTLCRRVMMLLPFRHRAYLSRSKGMSTVCPPTVMPCMVNSMLYRNPIPVCIWLRRTMNLTCTESSLTTQSGENNPDRAGRSARATMSAEAMLSRSQCVQPYSASTHTSSGELAVVGCQPKILSVDRRTVVSARRRLSLKSPVVTSAPSSVFAMVSRQPHVKITMHSSIISPPMSVGHDASCTSWNHQSSRVPKLKMELSPSMATTCGVKTSEL
mmetsp:Transcript_14821/g.62539  ORF Transcript_14821/g.62539 Transcript_14821/m.62539 type:complete len:282 (-) Transcript_14821:297-1142(-)